MPRKIGAKANAKGAIADGSHNFNSTAGPTRTGSTGTRGAKRRRTANNVNSNSHDIYGSGTIVAANPFDDDHHHNHLHHHHNQQHNLHQLPHGTTTSSKMMMPMQPPPPPPIHHHHQHQQAPQMNQMHQVYSSTYVQQAQQPPMGIPPPPHSHPVHMSSPPVGQTITGPPPPMKEHLGPANLQHPHPMHNHHMMVGPSHQNFGPPPPHASQTNQMIGTSTPPHMMGPGPAPSHSPYMRAPQPSSMIAPPHPPPPTSHQAMAPQPPHVDHMLMQQQQQQQQQQPYAMSHSVFCGECSREIYSMEPNIICKASCGSSFHISCSGLTQLACDLLKNESYAEWACARCTGHVPPVKYKT